MMLHQLLLLSCLASLSWGADESALISNLPGLLFKPTFRQYSGYLQASKTNRLHYWFVESQSNPSNDPFVLWLNGGPGCSSLDGLLSENGPLRIQDNLTLTENPYAWNKRANVLYLEAPAGVGFSVATDGNVTTDDDKVANENHAALVDFFTKFPEFKSNNFFVTGESYGGVYIPTLAVRLLSDTRFNFKGIAVGNGLSSYRYNDASLIYFAYYHGLFGRSTWKSLHDNCNCTGKARCFFSDDKSTKCNIAVFSASKALNGLNIYNLYGPCYHPNSGMVTHDFGNLFRSNRIVADERKLMNSVILKLNRGGTKIRLAPNCINDTAARLYLNMPSVRAALHIPVTVQEWELCSAEVGDHYQRTYQEMSAQYRQIMQSNKIRVLIYNGDVDMACNFLGDEWFFDDLNYPVDYYRRQWFVSSSYGQQVAGVSKSYAKGKLVFTTVRGAGHMVPSDRSVAASHMINTFILGQPL